MFEIKRSALLDELLNVSATDSVLITGAPGVGKSWLIGEFLKNLQSAGRFVLALSAEDFQVESVTELTSQIGLRQSIPALFASRGKGSILIVDGLDALRGESSQRVFRDVLLQVIAASPETHVVATIRAFDLAESPVFSALLGNYRGAQNPFKSMIVGPLNDSELLALRETRPNFEQLWTGANSDTREMLRNPFNLGIALALLRDGVPPDQLSPIGSQVRLLGEYWKSRVEAAMGSLERKRLLRELLEQMVSVRLLTIAETDLSTRVTEEALYGLLSNEVLKKGPTGRIGFTHNILFDYAVARLLLDEVKFITFVRDDPARALYYRPSLDFFFAYLWVVDQTIFWKVVRTLLGAERVPESTTIVPAVVLCQMADNVDALSPLISGPSENEDIVGRLLPKVLLGVQVLGMSSAGRRTIWLNLLERLSYRPSVDFINETFGVVVLLQQSARLSERPVLSASARRFVEWSWSYGETLPQDDAAQLASVVTGRLLPVVLATFDAEPGKNDKFVRQILARIGDPRAATSELFSLANDIKKIIEANPELAATVFRAAYDYTEISEAKTRFGSGSVLNLVSNRRQDYESMRYALGVHFRFFIERDPVLAANTAAWAVNAQVKRERPLNEGKSLEQISLRIKGYRTLLYTADYSEIWDSGSGRDYTSLQMLNAVLQFTADASDPNVRKSVVNALIKDASVAVIFKHVLEAASRSPTLFYDAVLFLVKVPRLISAPEVTIAVGEFLKAASAGKLIVTDDHREIEQAILGISRSRPLVRYEKSQSIQRRLLSCLDQEKLLDERSKKLLSNPKAIRENRPFVSVKGGAYQADSREALRMRGIDPEESSNESLLQASEAVQTFEQNYFNAIPPVEEAANIFNALVNLKNMINAKSGATKELLENARGVLLAAVESLLRNNQLSTKSEVFQFCRAVAIEGAGDPSPKFNKRYHLPFDHPGWGSPSPRIEAAQAIVHLVWNYPPDAQAFREFEKLSRDTVPAVRFQIARGLVGLFIRAESRGDFWRLFREMCAAESTSGVLVGLMDSLHRVASNDAEKAVAALHDFLERERPKADRSDVTRVVLDVLVGLYIERSIDSARHELTRFEGDVDKYQAELSQEILVAMQYVSPADCQNPEMRGRARAVLQHVLHAIRSSALQKLQLPPGERNLGSVATVMDTMASRLYFAFDLIGHRAPNQKEMSDADRAQLYLEFMEIFAEVAQSDVSDTDKAIPLVPQAAHHLLQLMNGILRFSPPRVLIDAYAICRHGARTGYLMDSMARSEAVKLVEAAIADHREVLREASVAEAVGGMLNLFTKAGWTEAVALTFKLDEAFR